MSDRELLELAAKACAIDVKWHDDGTAYSDSRASGYWGVWNPLADDGDALRLAVKLGLHLGICLDLPVGDCSYCKNDNSDNCIEMHYESDKFSATRRAIVRAAAEIGKTK